MDLIFFSEVRSPQGPLAMAGLRYGRPNCIRAAFGALSARAGFRKRQRNMLHRLKVRLLVGVGGWAGGVGGPEQTLGLRQEPLPWAQTPPWR